MADLQASILINKSDGQWFTSSRCAATDLGYHSVHMVPLCTAAVMMGMQNANKLMSGERHWSCIEVSMGCASALRKKMNHGYCKEPGIFANRSGYLLGIVR